MLSSSNEQKKHYFLQPTLLALVNCTQIQVIKALYSNIQAQIGILANFFYFQSISNYLYKIFFFPSNYTIYYSNYKFPSRSNMTQVSPDIISPLPDVQSMKKAILAEISDVTEEDLNVMQVQEITSFFLELKQACKRYSKQNQAIKKQKVGNKQKQKQKEEVIDLASDCKEDDQENKSGYYKPKFLSSNLYQLANNRLAIICGPPLQTTKEKMEAICSAYNPTIWGTIRSLKPQQIEQTYQRLRQAEIKQKFQLKDKNLTEKTFAIRVIKLDPPNFDSNLKNKTGLEQKEKKQILNGKKIHSSRKQIKNNLKPNHSILENANKYQKSKDQLIKKRENTIPIKTQMHILKFVQLPEHDNEEEDLTATIRHRQSGDLSDIQNEFAQKIRKIKVQNVRKYLLEPGDNPQSEVIQCFSAIKEMLENIHQIYQKQLNI